jgi:hypothetical protein
VVKLMRQFSREAREGESAREKKLPFRTRSVAAAAHAYTTRPSAIHEVKMAC